jgi:hypothetical protein
MCVVWEKGVVSERSTEFRGPQNINFVNFPTHIMAPTSLLLSLTISQLFNLHTTPSSQSY